MRIVTLLTDFGLAEPYVGQVKGAILGVAPQATIVDLTHAVAPQDIVAGAFLLASAVEVFPPPTIHLAVVDPGVGSPRRPVAVQAGRGDILVGPDNGLLWPAIERLGGLADVVELTERRFWRPVTSATFHARDIFGPVAGHLAAGLPLGRLGRRLADPIRLALPRTTARRGEVVHIDTYGNLITSFAAPAVRPTSQNPRLSGTKLRSAHRSLEAITLRIGPHLARGAPYYAAVAPGDLVCVAGSFGLLEISVRGGSAAALTGAQRGAPVTLERVRQSD